MFIIGTAGHVDHGKSTLIRRLTGIDPDRLAEEKAREMTIDLGFAWTKLLSGETIGFVDVPGHRDFVENMLSGITGIDVVLLVIAADEGIMPQTQEHLAIIDLLGVQHGVIALTKVDMVDDPEWLHLIEQDILSSISKTTLNGAPIIRVSARTGYGVDDLVQQLSALLAHIPSPVDTHSPRLPVDRVFSMKGFGTVVTGSLSGGSFTVGDEIEFQPANIRGRIRGLQSYGENVSTALPGNRVAVNVSGIERSLLERGNILTLPGQMVPTILVDVYFRHLEDVSRILAHNSEIKFFSGSAQSIGHVRLLADESLAPGSSGWIQIRLDQPLALSRNDHFILRLPSPSETIGGGIVVNPHPQMRWRRFQPEVIQKLELQMRGTASERIVEAASRVDSVSKKELQTLGIPEPELVESLTEAIASGMLREFSDGTYWATRAIERESQRLLSTLALFHQDNPLRLGMQREELRARLSLPQGMFNMLLELNKQVIADRHIARLVSHQITFNEQQEKLVALLSEKISASPYAPPSFSEACQLVGQDVAYALVELGELMLLLPDVILSKSAYENMLQAVLEILESKGNVSASELRDRFGTSRKYAIALLEYLDSNYITRRVGDVRVKGSRNP